MASQQIQTLLAPPNIRHSQSNVLEILNIHFSSVNDLNNLDSALADAQSQNDVLASELLLSQSKIDALVSETRTRAEGHLHSAQELSLLRHSLADELSYLSEELVSSMGGQEKKATLLEDIEALHRNLKELQSVKGYVQVIQHALKLSESAVLQIRAASSSSTSISPASVETYKTLQEFVTVVEQSCSDIKDGSGQQNTQLVTFLTRVRDATWTDIKGVLFATLLTNSEKLKWPMPVDYTSASPEDRRAFENAFLNLLRLQNIGEQIQPAKPDERSEKDGLYPLQALVQPVSLRFKYHFDGTRQTNRLDKPEWYFTHILNVVHEHRPFMESVVQRLLSSTQYRGINSWREFTRLLLPLLSRKLNRTVPALLPHPSLLAHTIYQALAFDAALLEEGFGISGTSIDRDLKDAERKWDGVSQVILGKKEWFEAWMEGEKKFAEDQYHEIISAPEAWLVADDEGGREISFDSNLKSTNSARRIKALVEQVTDRYSPLPHFTQRTRFLISVQLPLLEYYHDRISSSLDAFETLSSVFIRAVPGSLGVSLGGKEGAKVNVDTKRLTSGVEGVQRLSKALVSAKFLGMAIEGWGEELFFLELWAEINHRSSLRARAEANRSLPDPTASETDAPEGTIFQELVTQYDKLVSRAEEMIVQQVCGEIEGEWKVHFVGTASNKPTPEDIALSQTLLAPIALLSSHLTFLRSTLPITTVTSLYRHISSRLAEHILQRQILYRGHNRISHREGKAIMAESELWVETCHAALSGMGRSRVEAPWLNLLQAGILVGGEGEMWDRVVDLTFGTSGNAEWEEAVSDIIGVSEIGRDGVAKILRSREDCER